MKVKYFQKNTKQDYSEIYELLKKHFENSENSEATINNVSVILDSFNLQYYTRESDDNIMVFNLKNEYILYIKK